ncbi:MAG: AcrR family transcriptional regulator [Candidatus Azotimanducaceae bacterium]|jgi:AcrR family transcriptional regulator
MSSANLQSNNRNDAKSNATRSRLVASTIDSLMEIGFTKTTGVEVCRRAGLTRGALNHHFPDFADLLVETIRCLYLKLLNIKSAGDFGLLEQILMDSHTRVIQPEFKAVIELWLASRNDEAFGSRLAQAIASSAELFSLEMMLVGKSKQKIPKEFEPIYRTIMEALIGVGLGRAVGKGQPLAHESMVLEFLQNLTRQYGGSPE